MCDIKNIKAVMFDFDMTLADTSYAIEHCTNLLASNFGLALVPREKILRAIGLPIEESWIFFWGDYKEEWLEYYRSNFRGVEQSMIRLFPGTVETLKTLSSRGVKVGVVSNRYYAKRPVESTGLTGLLDAVVGLEDVEHPKPSPDSLFKGFELVGVSPSEGIYVGDTDIDMKTSVAAGACGIGMTTGNFDSASLMSAGAKMVCGDLREILSLKNF
ncbi:MAG: HAD family hydrolase [Synergistaceae bacterium]